MDRTRPAHLIPGGFAGDEADELEDVGQRNPGPDCGKVNARHGWSLRTESRGIIRAGAARPSSGGNREDSHGGNWSDWVSKAMYGRSLCRRTGDLFICTHGSRWPSGATSVDSRTTSRHSEISGEHPTQPYPTFVVRQSATLLYGFAPQRKLRRCSALRTDG